VQKNGLMGDMYDKKGSGYTIKRDTGGKRS
jgi:hypothetical protein